MRISQEFLDKLVELAKRRVLTGSAGAYISDFSGGNEDDAYFGGVKDGETLLAREILNNLEQER